MEAVIFSKDRPLQLDCLIRSIYQNCDYFTKATVLYKTKFPESYDILKYTYPDFNFIKEESFKDDFTDIILDAHDRVCLLVDDDIIFKKIEGMELLELIDEVDIVSLRLGNNITKKEHFKVKSSVDGNIFKRSDLKMMSKIRFNNPNELESRMAVVMKDKSMGWFNESRLIGVPANRVSATSGCFHMNVSVEDLNDIFLSGQIIDYNKMELESNNVHKSVDYKFKEQC